MHTFTCACEAKIPSRWEIARFGPYLDRSRSCPLPESAARSRATVGHDGIRACASATTNSTCADWQTNDRARCPDARQRRFVPTVGAIDTTSRCGASRRARSSAVPESFIERICAGNTFRNDSRAVVTARASQPRCTASIGCCAGVTTMSSTERRGDSKPDRRQMHPLLEEGQEAKDGGPEKEELRPDASVY